MFNRLVYRGSSRLASRARIGGFESAKSFSVKACSTVPAWNSTDSGQGSFNYQGLLWLTLALSLSSSIAVSNCDAKDKEQKPKHWPVITRKEVERHNTVEKHVWVTYKDSVYDVTHFIANHPGGKEKLMSVAGQDIASQWALYAHHKSSPLAMELLEELKIGVLPTEDIIEPPKVEYVAKYSNKPIYDVIIVGGGLSGLQTGWSLVNQHKVDPKKILILEAQDYIGGRVKQIDEFVKGAKIEVGAEFLHGKF
jgi:cytochrome b involved in lipid metabolism